MAARSTTTKKAAATADPNVYEITIGDVPVKFDKPEPGQIAALRRAGLLFESSEVTKQNRGGMLFLDVLDAMVKDQDVLDQLYQGLATKTIPLDEYAECAITLLKHFGQQSDAAPTTGPIAGTRRARARTR